MREAKCVALENYIVRVVDRMCRGRGEQAARPRRELPPRPGFALGIRSAEVARREVDLQHAPALAQRELSGYNFFLSVNPHAARCANYGEAQHRMPLRVVG